MMRVCSKCKRELDIKFFSKDNSRKRGTHSHCKKCVSEYYQNNKEKILKQRAEYRKRSRDKIRKWDNEWSKKKRKIDPKFKLSQNISRKMRKLLNLKRSEKSWRKLLGYTIDDLKIHLEKQFKPGMTWNNYGKNGWHIDHKIPVSVFNFTTPEHGDFKKCWALNNLQPLWAEENYKKNNKLERHFQPGLLIN